MIERILLVAWTELSATLLTRAFIMMVLTPVIAVLATPLIVAPIVFLVEMVEDGTEEASPKLPLVEVYDADGRVFPLLEAHLEERWDVALLHTDPRLAAETPFDGEVKARLVISADDIENGSYTLHMREMAREQSTRSARRLESNIDDVLGVLRLEDAGLSTAAIQTALDVEGTTEWIEVSTEARLESLAELLDQAVPTGVLFMMFAALSMAGQGLLTSTLEEKSTRVAEVLLGAVSPVELLTGKILGQLGVTLVFSLVWGLPTLALLGWFGAYYLGPLTVLYVVAFIGIAAMSWAAVMGGIGSAVNDLTEAQHLLAPLFMVMMVLFLPAALAIALPESNLVLVASLLPPSSSAVMAARLTSSAPPPHWQVWISLLTSGAFALFLLFLAGRLFRIGLLLRGSPPNIRTLIRWLMTS